MGIFSLFRKKPAISAEDQAVIDNFRSSVEARLNAPPQNPLTHEEYQAIRNAEREWLEAHYDFSTVKGIESIPERKDIPRPPGRSATGDVYYYLQYKARLYEKAGNIELAIVCMRKSIALMQAKYGGSYGKQECDSYVRMLIRNGYTEEARIQKHNFEQFYNGGLDRMRLQNFQIVCQQAADLKTDLLIMDTRSSTCPECAKYQGRVFSISGKSKLFPALPQTIKEIGVVHPGCHHQFFPYIHKVTRVHMDYTLKVHPLQNPIYGLNIITFSNRPFSDDRTEDCKRAAQTAREQRNLSRENKKRYEEILYQKECEKRNDYSDYEWLKAHFPDRCPTSASGYRRMKTQNTKNYQMLKQLAAELGKEI